MSGLAPLRVALFHSTLPGPGRKVGGVEVFVHRLASRLTERGHTVTVVTFQERPSDASYRVLRVGDPWICGRAARLTVAPALLNRLDHSRFDVLHLHGDDWFFWRRRIPTVRTFHGSALFESRTATSHRRRTIQSLVYPLEALSSRLATLSFAGGSGLPRGYRTDGSLGYAVEQPLRKDPPRRSDHPVILFVGTWAGRKRGAFLASRFAAEVLPRHPTAELVMVSDWCPALTGVRWVRFPSDEELSHLYSTAWVFCMPSSYEGFGMPYLEAMTHGLPVVATPNPGALHVIERGAGLIVDDDDLGRSLADLLGDPGARRRLAASGSRRSQAFSWARVVEQHEAAYQLAIERFRPGAGA